MEALDRVTAWPVEHVAAAVSAPHGLATIGDPHRRFRIASLTKPIVAWAVMIGVEEGIVELDAALAHVDAPPGATLRHLLAHAAGFGFDGSRPIAPIEQRRIYSNTGIERAAAELAAAADMPFEQYLREAVLGPLRMSGAELHGSPAHGVSATLSDLIAWIGEMRAPRLIAAATWHEVTSPQYPTLAGIVPDVGRFDPCPWGLGVEIHGAKAPHWMGRANSPATFGHFGGGGSMMWVDPAIDTALVALSDRPFGQWRDTALAEWPALSDAVVSEVGRAA